MKNIISIGLNDIDGLHQDLFLKISSINFIVIADSYYYILDNSLSDNFNVEKNKNSIICNALKEWKNKIINFKKGNTYFLPFDFSDQYIGCLRLEAINDTDIQGSYGITQKILGMMINPSQLEQFDIDDLDFENDSESFFINKDDLIFSVESSIESIGKYK